MQAGCKRRRSVLMQPSLALQCSAGHESLTTPLRTKHSGIVGVEDAVGLE